MWVTKWFLPQGQWEAVLGGVVPELHTDRLLLLLCSHKSLAVCLVSLLISLQICVCGAPFSLPPEGLTFHPFWAGM